VKCFVFATTVNVERVRKEILSEKFSVADSSENDRAYQM
jgi:hypothetical protein